MHKLTITGYSDDIVSVEGDINDELYSYSDDEEEMVLAISDGSLFRVKYDEDGLWRFTRLVPGAVMEFKPGDVPSDSNDVVVLQSPEPFIWAVLGTRKTIAEKE